MDYMLVTKRGGQTRHRHALMWSLLGSCIAFAAHGRWQLVLTSLHLQRLLLSGRNPYIRSFQTGGVTPPAETLLPQIILHQYNEGIRNAR